MRSMQGDAVASGVEGQVIAIAWMVVTADRGLPIRKV
jgi:hypothetical protein